MRLYQASLAQAVAAADILVGHWWNHPLLYAWMASEGLPKARALLWSHVSGLHPPRIITPPLLARPDLFAAANPVSLRAPAVAALPAEDKEARLRLIFSSGGISHVEGHRAKGGRAEGRAAGRGFRVGYLGTVDHAKTHPGFLGLCLAADIGDAVFPVAGGPSHESLRREAGALGASDSFEILGPIENVGGFLAGLDVFGYPLLRENYGTG